MNIKSLKFGLILMVLGLMNSVAAQNLTAEEQKLYDLIMAYRKEKGLPVIPISKSLTKVAQTHVRDLADNRPDVGKCGPHSWSDQGEWSACCYTPDHLNASCMWSKPEEIAGYRGAGYEIAFKSSRLATPETALMGWKLSPGHHAVVINQGSWRAKWNAIGIGMYKGYAVAWFGRESDL